MPDAAIPITQTAVKQFTRQYLSAVGCSIDADGERWHVSVSEAAETDVVSGDVTLLCTRDAEDADDEGVPLHPESDLFQRLLTEATDRTPVGRQTIGTATDNVDIPPWLSGGAVEVADAEFFPIYDRTAVVFLFQVSIETVSEYQREFLQPVAVDTRSQKSLPGLEKTFLDVTSLGSSLDTADQVTVSSGEVSTLLETSQGIIEDRIQPEIDETLQDASRAADVEVEEFRQLQEQRIEELEVERESISEKIDELSERADDADADKRVEILKERKERNATYEELEEELAELRRRRDQGFPEKQREIRNRHALDVRISPLTATEVVYEQGEVEVELGDGQQTCTVTVGYGSGVGLTEDVLCVNCAEPLSEQRPVQHLRTGPLCEDCS